MRKQNLIIYQKAALNITVDPTLLQSEKILRNLNQLELWHIQAKKYQQENWKQLFSHMKYCTAEQLWLGGNERSQIEQY